MEEVILKEREYRKELVKITNETGLPAIILKPIVKELYDELVKLEQQQYETALRIKEEREKENQEKENQEKEKEE